jgi:hypothetical protein
VITQTVQQTVYLTTTQPPVTVTATTTVGPSMSTSIYDNGLWHPSDYYTDWTVTTTLTPVASSTVAASSSST